MIIYPSTSVPIDKPEAPLSDIHLFPVCQTREDAAKLLPASVMLPPPDPTRRLKYWVDPAFVGVEDDGEPVSYLVVHFDSRTGVPVLDANGMPRTRTLILSKTEAGRFNVPYNESANEFPPSSVAAALKPLPVPIRNLHPDEYLAVAGGFGAVVGQVVVRNRRLYQAPAKGSDGFTEKDRALLIEIARALGIAV